MTHVHPLPAEWLPVSIAPSDADHRGLRYGL